MATANLTVERLRELLDYDPETGVLTNRVQRQGYRVEPGTVAGTLNKHGYIQVAVCRRQYKAHRLAWLMVHGEWPKGNLDHINGCKSDNRISNLREVKAVVNLQNLRAAKSHNELGLLGVRASRDGGKFTARITVDEKEWHLGTFATADAAHQAYLAAKRKLHEGCTI